MADRTETTTPNNVNRPLSPHLTIYKPQITSMMSISHRITGALLSAGLVVFIGWIWCVAYCPIWAEKISEYLQTPVAKGLIIAWLFFLYYHFINGIRHLFWDAGQGLELPAVHRSGVITILGSIFITWFTWVLATLELVG